VPRRGTLTAALVVGLAGCGGTTIESTGAAGDTADGSECGQVDLAVNPWVGYEANAAVIAEVAETELGCTVTKKDLAEEISWQGFGTGEVDAIVENWGHEDLKQQYVEEQGTAVLAGPTGNTGTIGWWVPPWMAEEYPDITDWRNLNRYASIFETSESGGKGQLLDGDPSFVTNDEALVQNLDLDFQVVYAGSEAALITAFRTAQAEREPLLGYFYAPQWFMSEVPLVQVELPPHTPGCDADPGDGRLRLPGVRARQDHEQGVRRVGVPGRRAHPQLHVDQRRPEPRRPLHRRGRHVAGGGREEVDRRQPRGRRGLAALTSGQGAERSGGGRLAGRSVPSGDLRAAQRPPGDAVVPGASRAAAAVRSVRRHFVKGPGAPTPRTATSCPSRS
jgi:glycine betaine/proline transport system substrate-binding protein